MSVVNVLSEWLKTESERLNKSYAVLRKQFDNKNKPLVNRWKKFLKTQSFSAGIIKGKGGGQSAPVAPAPQEIPSLEGELAKMEYEKRIAIRKKQVEAYVAYIEEKNRLEAEERRIKEREKYSRSYVFADVGDDDKVNPFEIEGGMISAEQLDRVKQLRQQYRRTLSRILQKLGMATVRGFPQSYADLKSRLNSLMEIVGDIDRNGSAAVEDYIDTLEQLETEIDGRIKGSGIIEGEGLGLSIARKIYDWYKPPIDFEEWRARQQDRFSSDAEAEAALEEAKASRVLREAETALNKLKVDTAEYKKKLLAIRNEKVRLAREIGVWVGDDRNPVDWDSARAETARRESERERIQREETDYDVVGEGLKAMNRTIHYLKEKRGMRRPPLDLNNPDYISYKKLRDSRDMVKSYLKSGR